jgi:hypothetical protein
MTFTVTISANQNSPIYTLPAGSLVSLTTSVGGAAFLQYCANIPGKLEPPVFLPAPMGGSVNGSVVSDTLSTSASVQVVVTAGTATLTTTDASIAAPPLSNVWASQNVGTSLVSASISTFMRDQYASSSPADIIPVIGKALVNRTLTTIGTAPSQEQVLLQEGNLFKTTYNGQTYYHNLYTTSNALGSFSVIGYAWALDPRAPRGTANGWTNASASAGGAALTGASVNAVLGSGSSTYNDPGSTTSVLAHSGLYVDSVNGVGYFSVVNLTTTKVSLYQFSLSFNPLLGPTLTKVSDITNTPAAWLTIAGNVTCTSTAFGNQAIVPMGGANYALIFEALASVGANNTSDWALGIALSTTGIGGPYTPSIFPLVSLQQGQIAVSLNLPSPYRARNGGPFALVENGLVVMCFHGGPPGRYQDDVYRATIPLASINADAWVYDNNAFPILRRPLSGVLVDQAVDFTAVQGPAGNWYTMIAGGNVNAGNGTLHALSLFPSLIVTDPVSGRAVAVQRPTDQEEPLGVWNAIDAGNTALTLNNRDWVYYNTGLGTKTFSLPKCNSGAVCRVSAFGNGGGSMIVAAQSGDVFSAGNNVGNQRLVVPPGGTVEFYGVNAGGGNGLWLPMQMLPLGSPPAAAAISVTASPFTYTNVQTGQTLGIQEVNIIGGTITSIVKNRSAGGTFTYPAGTQVVNLAPADSVVVTYTVAPTMQQFQMS